MKAIVVTDQAAGTAGMTLAERPELDAITVSSPALITEIPRLARA